MPLDYTDKDKMLDDADKAIRSYQNQLRTFRNEIDQLRADKTALTEMLNRTAEFLANDHNFRETEMFLHRIDSLLAKVR